MTTRTEAWLMAARPKTLPAAASAVIVGVAAAIRDGVFSPLPALAALLIALLLQIGANIANDLFDFYRGADTAERLGPTRVTQAGLLSPHQVRTGMWVTFGLAALLGVYLVWRIGWAAVWIGVLAILAAVAYSGGPFPYGYYALGDLAVFIFFGPVAVAGTYLAQAGMVSPLAWWASLPMGLLITAILVVNNLRDIETDRAAGKRTLAVLLGPRGTRLEYLLCLLLAYLSPLVMGLSGVTSFGGLLTWFSLPLAYRQWRGLHNEGRALNVTLAGTARLTLIYALLFSLGIVLIP
ncbi:MAG: 1,4-dihydroxy-2-naphthoate polyprenyltransferase [Anaerolineae bacterium]|nr:MAG: 1,4-dihydroxy-2-naphthoate polyprenyltransferase [Anaerolineae bacterium]